MDKVETSNVDIERIVIDAGTQMRSRICETTVSEYGQCLAELPPLDVLRVGVARYVLVDGFHRYYAFKRAGYESIPIRVLGTGDIEAAQLLAARANQRHGLRRTNQDKRNAVAAAIRLLPRESDRGIAELVGVDGKTVAAVRRGQQVESILPEVNDDDDYESPTQAREPEPEPEESEEVSADKRLANARKRISNLVSQLNQWHGELTRVLTEEAGTFINEADVERLVVDMRSAIKLGTPTAICPACKGGRCNGCMMIGYVSAGRERLLRAKVEQASRSGG